MKRLKKLMLMSLMAGSLILPTATSCSLLGGGEEGVMISAITASTNKDGDTELTITFTDEDIEPVTFLIPKGTKGEEGDEGKQGLGIKNITSSQSEDGKHTILTINYTDKTVPPTLIEVSNGVSVVDIDSVLNADNNTTVVTFHLSDGTSKTFEIPNGKDGKDGVGIVDVITEHQPNGDYIVTIKYTDKREDTVITLPNKNGEDGRGIDTIVGNQVGNEYTITINYSDGSSTDLTPIILPEATKWISGEGEPTSRDVRRTKEGDYYFDTLNFIIYIRKSTGFEKVVDLKADNASKKQYEVIFDANGGEFTSNIPTTIKVTAGRPIDMIRIPQCKLEGKTFMGYYTTVDGPLNPLSGKLTDLTPIFRDQTFYAYYE